jgi:hypothetical protein
MRCIAEGSEILEKELIPVVKIGSENTYHPQYMIPCDTYVVKTQELLTSSGTRFNKHYVEIKNKGGFHEFFKDECKVILSLIMPDKTIAGCDQLRYLLMIQELNPNLIISPDGETYQGDVLRSKYVIEKSLECIDFLLNRGIEPRRLIGLVLGANFQQIDWYIDKLLNRGIRKFCFHAGDFRFRRDSRSKRLALDIARHIRQRVPYLMIYGGGCRKFFQLYHFANAFVTQSHFVSGFKHKKICRRGQKNLTESYRGVLSWEIYTKFTIIISTETIT